MSVFRSLQRRLALQVSLALLLFALVVGLAAFAQEIREERDEARAALRPLVDAVRQAAAVAAQARDGVAAQRVVETLLAEPAVASVTLVAADGFKHGIRRTGTRDDDERVAFALQSASGAVVGSVLVRLDAAELRRRACEAAGGYALLLGVQAVLSAWLLVVLVRRIVGEPLVQVARRLHTAEPGAGGRLAMPPGHERDEIGMLVAGGNALLEAAERSLAEERRLRSELATVQSRHRRIVDGTRIGIFVMTPDGRLLESNAALLERFVAPGRVEAARRHFAAGCFATPSAFWQLVAHAHVARQPAAADLQLVPDADGERWAHAVVTVEIDAEGRIDRVDGVLHDVTARRRGEIEARRAAEIDPLTGLANRRGLERFLAAALSDPDRRSVAVIALDLDGFKAVNDEHGHAAGDRLLRMIGGRLSRRIRGDEDLVARAGGDEFVVVLVGIDSRDALVRIAADLVAAAAEPVRGFHRRVAVGASLGVACRDVDGDSAAALLAAADGAMYAVKRNGKNGFAFASGTTAAPAAESAATGVAGTGGDMPEPTGPRWSDFARFEAEMLARGFDDVVERRWAPGAEVPEHDHPFELELLVVDGEMQLESRGETRRIGPGERLALAHGERHAERYGDAGAVYWVARRHRAG